MTNFITKKIQIFKFDHIVFSFSIHFFIFYIILITDIKKTEYKNMIETETKNDRMIKDK